MSPTGGQKDFGALTALRLPQETLDYYRTVADRSGMTLSTVLRVVLEGHYRRNKHSHTLVIDLTDVKPGRQKAKRPR